MPFYRVVRTVTRRYVYDVWRADAQSAEIAVSNGPVDHVESKEGVELIECTEEHDTTVIE